MENNDALIAAMVLKMRGTTEGFPTLDRITACYNLLHGFFSLCSVYGKKEDLKKVAVELHDALMEHIEDLYDGRS